MGHIKPKPEPKKSIFHAFCFVCTKIVGLENAKEHPDLKGRMDVKGDCENCGTRLSVNLPSKDPSQPACACRGRFSGDSPSWDTFSAVLSSKGMLWTQKSFSYFDFKEAWDEAVRRTKKNSESDAQKETELPFVQDHEPTGIVLHNLAQSCEKREGRNWFLLIATVAWLLTALAVPTLLLAGAWRLLR